MTKKIDLRKYSLLLNKPSKFLESKKNFFLLK
jgi:hypothetical protein